MWIIKYRDGKPKNQSKISGKSPNLLTWLGDFLVLNNDHQT